MDSKMKRWNYLQRKICPFGCPPNFFPIIGALRAAHVGIALSQSEASIVSPFSCGNRSVHACVEVVKEGKNALACSFASFKCMFK